MTSSAHRLKLYSVNTTRPETAKRLAFLKEHGERIEDLTVPMKEGLEDMDEYLSIMRKHPREPLA